MQMSAKCSVAVHCLIFISEYGGKTKVTSELLSKSTGCNPVTIRSIMSALKKDGMLLIKSGTGGAELGCPLEEITLYRVMMAVEPDALEKVIGLHSTPSELCPVGRNIHGVLQQSYQKVREDMKQSLSGVTLQQVAADYHTALEKE
jgi:DNA-binding IscR family transcriptional regulator